MMDDALPENAATNTWYFSADTPTGVTNMQAGLYAFYQSIGSMMSNDIDMDSSVIKWYELDGLNPTGPPDIEQSLLGVGTGLTAGVPEVALVMAYRSALTGPPFFPGRHRGRVYIGPLASTSGNRPAASTVTQLRDAGAALLLDSSNGGVGTTEYLWLQRSQTAASFSEVDAGYVDNEFDTQRRRGRKATSRDTF